MFFISSRFGSPVKFCTLRRTEVLFARRADFATREIKKTAPCASAINRQETAILKRNRIIKIPPSEFRLCVDAWYRRFCAAYQRFTNVCFFAISYYKQTFAICQSNIQRFFGKRGFKGQVSAFCDTSRRFEKMSLTREKAGFLAKNLLKNIMSLHYNVCK